jgi:hypothetical protein
MVKDFLKYVTFSFHLVKGMRKEYGHARSLAIAQAQVLCAHDEIKMATTRLHLKENENDINVDALSQEELPSASVQYSDDKFISLALLSRIKGKLRYLKVQTRSLLESFKFMNSFRQYIFFGTVALSLCIISRVWYCQNKDRHWKAQMIPH